MPIPTRWKIAGATAAATGIALGGLITVAPGDDGGSSSEIALRDARLAAETSMPDSVASPTDPDDGASPDGESVDSPLQSADDSPNGQDSIDSPEPAPAPAPPPPPAPAASSWDSPASVASAHSAASVDSAASADSAD